MTVKELIEQLQLIADNEKEVVLLDIDDDTETCTKRINGIERVWAKQNPACVENPTDELEPVIAITF